MHERQAIQIREDNKGRILLTGLQQIPINSVDDLLNALNFGSSIRQTDATAINSKSSRSHAVFSLSLVLKKPQNFSPDAKRMSVSSDPNISEHWVTTDSKLHFVDLAGSERLKNSGLTGERVKEGISINAGLASLGKVISQLSSRSAVSHVSYRDSRLTRLLQDSLGGNAITYMVACVNPVEFHLSETLNTVQYAQRARNIQSKPQIQQRAEDGDKQLVIDRLRSEVAFLRDQIRHADRSDRRSTREPVNVSKNARENELQNQLLDIQESYGALSQRHAKLVSEIARSKGNEEEGMPELRGIAGANSLDRLKRSNNFQEAVEAVVLEYEKTIQSLESSLSNARSSLSTSESNLLEREGRLVYLEAVTQQLNQRLQKTKDRETTSDSYLRDLETKLDGVSSGEEKHNVALKDLRKELARVRESEESAEEYISTLEERLAEAEQDTDIMQREIRRLEHVVERQRTVGKMDNLLHELDNLRQEEVRNDDDNGAKKHSSGDSDAFHDRLVATTDALHPNGEMTHESAEQEWKTFGPMEGEDETASQISTTDQTPLPNQRHSMVNGHVDKQSPAQSKAMADKLETVTIELFDLRVDHESTVAELDDVSRKYQIALSTLAELQDAMDDARVRPSSFLGPDGSKESRENGGFSASRTLQSDLSSRTESPTLVEASEAGASDSGTNRPESLMESLRRLKRANAEKDINMAELNGNFEQLSDQHQTTLKYVEELKEELAKAAKEQPSSPNTLSSPTVIRRSSSQNTLLRDRESRNINTLRHLAVDHLHGKQGAAQTFEQNISALEAESTLRNERVEALEAEMKALRNEMDVKNTMISGLTRERSVRPTSGLDMNMVMSMRDHLSQSQKQLASLLESREANESSMQAEFRSLKLAFTKRASTTEHLPGEFPETANEDESTVNKQLGATDPDDDEDRIVTLQKEVDEWQEKHKSTMDSVHASEQDLLATIASLEMSLSNAETAYGDRAGASPNPDKSADNNVDFEAEKARHVEQVTALQKEIDGYKATRDAHTSKLMQLESSYNQFMKEMEEEAKSRKLTESELQTQRELVQNLEQQIEQQKSLSEFHQSGLKSLEESHSKELDELRTTLDAQRAQADARLTEQLNKHQESTTSLQGELTKAHTELSQLMQSVAVALALDDGSADTATLDTRLRSLATERKSMSKNHEDLSEALKKAQGEMQSAKQITIDQNTKIKELTSLNDTMMKEIERTTRQERKSSQLVQDLEEQLNNAFDTHKSVQNRLSTMSSARADAERELEEHRSRVTTLEGQLTDLKRQTMSSASGSQRGSLLPSDDGTKSKSAHSSMPGPPPVTPLPPLPSLSESGNLPQPPRSPKPGESFNTGPSEEQKQLQAKVDEQENRIKTIEKHLYAEKQLTQTLEEALVDLETTANKSKSEADGWKKQKEQADAELNKLKQQRGEMRNSLQAVEEERDRRLKAEAARRQLEERMDQLGQQRKKKKGGLNCF